MICYNQGRWLYSKAKDNLKDRYIKKESIDNEISFKKDNRDDASEDFKKLRVSDLLSYTDLRIESDCEMNTQYTKDLLIDLKNNFSDDQIDKLISIELIQHRLTTPERLLFDMYFNQQLSGREIARKAKLPRNAAINMVNSLIKKIKQELSTI